MKKNIFALIIILMCVFVFRACNTTQVVDDSEEKNAVLMVNGETIESAYVSLYSFENQARAELPFMTVMKALGFSPVWIDDDTVSYEIDNETYILLRKEMTLYNAKKGKSINLLLPPPGSEGCICDEIDDEIIADDETIWSALYLMGIKSKFMIDTKQNVVKITTAYSRTDGF